LLAVLGALVGARITEWGWGARLALGVSGAVAVAIAISAGVIAVIAIVKVSGRFCCSGRCSSERSG
jgi:hypothetical protein